MNAKRLVLLAGLFWSRAAFASLSASPPTIAIGNVDVGATGTGSTTVSESAGLETIASFDLGSCTADFAVTTAPPVAVTGGMPQTINVSFKPTVRLLQTCTVTMRDATSAALGTFQITGTGQAAELGVSGTASFGSVRFNNGAPVHSSTQVFTITNTGDTGHNLTVNSITFSGTNPADYAVTAGTFPTTIAAGGNSTWTVTFDPAAAGASSATMNIASTDPVTPTKMVAVSGTGTTAVIAVSNITYGTVNVGQNLVSNISVTNTGAAPKGPLGVTSATMMNDGGWFTFNSGCIANGGTSCTFSPALSVTNAAAAVPIKCQPPANAVGTQLATVTFTSDTDSATNDTAMLSCTAGRATVSVDTASLDFTTQLVGSTSAAKTVTITNTGNINLTYTVTVSGSNASQFAVSSGATGCITSCTVAPSGTKTFDVKFSPTSEGLKNATNAHIVSNDPASPLDVALQGTGIAPDITGPPSLAYGNVEVGKTSSQTLTITNTGTSTLTISNAGLSTGTQYAVTAGTVGAQSTMIAPAGTASWTIACVPTTFGALNDTFKITSNALNAPSLSIPLGCTGQQGVLTIIPSTFDFMGVRIGDVVTHNFTLTNTGNVAVNTITATLSSNLVGYSITAPAFPITTLGAGSSVTVTVQFAPTAPTDGGAVTATFAGVWGTSNTTTMAVLSLNGSALVAGYDFAPKPQLDFGTVRFDQNSSLPFTLTDTNSSSVTIQSLNIMLGTAQTGEFTITGITHNGNPVTLPFALTGLNDTIRVMVKCQPANRVAMLSATVIAHSDLGTNPDRMIPLVANSVTAGISVAPATNVVDYGGVDLHNGPITQMITLTNNGTASLNTGAAVKAGPDLARFTFTASGAQVIPPAGSFSVSVTYTPTLERASNNPDTASITFPIAGVFGGPSSVAVMLQGYGTDRHLQIAPLPTFPDTFRNPGDKAPTLPVTITNGGDATLSVSAVMLTNDPIWTLVNMDPVDVPGHSSYDFMVRFAPTTAGMAPDGTLQIIDNDTKNAMVQVVLHGNGIDRNVEMGPPVIDLPYTGIGSTIRLSDVATSELLHVASMDSTNTFQIRSIAIVGADGAFVVEDATGAAPANIPLAPNATQKFDIAFTPPYEGAFEATATLYLDMDPSAQTTVTLRGHALYVDAKGGGGCEAGGGAGGGMILVVGALLLGRRRRQLAVLVVALVPAIGRADTRNLDLSVFDPTPATRGEGFQLQSASVGANGELVATALVSYANNPLVLDTVQNPDPTIKNRTTLELGGAYAFLGRVEAGARMPLYIQSGGTVDASSMFGEPPATGTARGDLTLHAKLRLWRGAAAGGELVLGTGASLTLPTATDGEFAGVMKPAGRALGLLSLTPRALGTRLTLNLNAGGVFRAKTQFHSIDQGSGVAWGVGVSFRVLDEMWVAAEMFGDLIPSGHYGVPMPMQKLGAAETLSTVEALAGLHYQLERRVSLGVAVGRGVTSGIGSPDVRGVLSLSFAPGAAAIAPIHGIRPPFVDGDRDGDGIPDSIDKCPDEPEDKDMFDDADGCPDPDNDGDGIPDDKDKCPLDPEDKDGFEDADGCPDLDNDHDGIPDKLDKCPNEPEDKDGFQDLDGCPDLDNDGDGIPDAKDKCPNEPETINGFQDDDGCPDKGDGLVVLTPDRLELLDAVQFTGGTRIAKGSFNVLGQVGATLRAHPELVRVRVTSHVQPTSNPDRDQEVSDKRSQAVHDWLVQWGVKPSRLEAKGFGGTKPLVPADTKGSAAINDRLELIILERK